MTTTLKGTFEADDVDVSFDLVMGGDFANEITVGIEEALKQSSKFKDILATLDRKA